MELSAINEWTYAYEEALGMGLSYASFLLYARVYLMLSRSSTGETKFLFA